MPRKSRDKNPLDVDPTEVWSLSVSDAAVRGEAVNERQRERVWRGVKSKEKHPEIQSFDRSRQFGDGLPVRGGATEIGVVSESPRARSRDRELGICGTSAGTRSSTASAPEKAPENREVSPSLGII